MDERLKAIKATYNIATLDTTLKQLKQKEGCGIWTHNSQSIAKAYQSPLGIAETEHAVLVQLKSMQQSIVNYKLISPLP